MLKTVSLSEYPQQEKLINEITIKQGVLLRVSKYSSIEGHRDLLKLKNEIKWLKAELEATPVIEKTTIKKVVKKGEWLWKAFCTFLVIDILLISLILLT